MSQFDPEQFHESTYDLGMSALRTLAAALEEETKVLPDNVFGVTELLHYRNPYKHIPTTVQTQYRVIALGDIHPDVIMSNEYIPDYLAGTLGSLAVALVDHINHTQDRHGDSPSFPPDMNWFKSHLSSTWFTLPRYDHPETYEAKLYSLGNWRTIDLVLAKDKDVSDWKVEFVQRTRRELVLSYFVDHPANVIEVFSS